jgi:hypothetical protein
MAIHRRFRKAAHLPLQVVRRERAAVEGCRARGRLARDSQAHRRDQRLAALAAAVRVDRSFESSWELLRYGLFNGLTHEEAEAKLGAWCTLRISNSAAMRELGAWADRRESRWSLNCAKSGSLDMIYVLMMAR